MARLPSLYITHGGGPCFWTDLPPPLGPHAYDGLRDYFSGLLATLTERPAAVMVISAHWEAAVPTLATTPAPGMLYDYYGFPPHTYELRYPAPGSPELAMRALQLLGGAGIAAGTDAERGFDHAVFVPMLIIDPAARIPVVTLSLQRDLDPAFHLAVGAALAPLRDEGVLLLGSGSSYHNLPHIFKAGPHTSVEFDAWLNDTAVLADAETRWRNLINWTQAPGALGSHPRAEHLLPLMVAVGAAGSDAGRNVFHQPIGGKLYSCFAFG